MPVIKLDTIIKADIEVCFDLSTSIDLHCLSTAKTNEKAIAGVTTGLIRNGEEVTWKAKHFGIVQKLTSRITAYNRPFYFRDEMVSGAFKLIKHDHFFKQGHSEVLMSDIFEFKSPLGVLGYLADTFVLKRYLTRFLLKRNDVIRQYAESGKYKLLPGFEN